jgi:spermidine/putrescine transport system permease protein
LRLGRAALGANAWFALAFLYLPILVLIFFSFNDSRSVARWTGFSMEWYLRLFDNEPLLRAARNSLLIAFVATLASTAMGTLTALGMDRYRFRLRSSFDAMLYLPIVIPEIVLGISLLLFFNLAFFPLLQALLQVRLTLGLPTITIAHIAFDIPFVYVIVRARLVGFDRTLEQAAQDLGPGILGGALMAFTLSLDDFLVTAFTAGTASPTMPLYIYSLVRRGVTPEINALSTVLLVASMGLIVVSLVLQRRR